MRDELEIRRAIVILGATLASRKLRQFVWEGQGAQAAGRAWAAFSALGWVEGADECSFAQVLEYAALKLEQYAQCAQETENAN